MCLNSEKTCSLNGYSSYYKDHISSQELDMEILSSEYKQVTNKLPKSINTDQCCTVISVLNTLKKQDQYVICTRVEE